MKFVTYLRVSTQRQGASGLGLEAQRSMVAGFIKDADSVQSEYVEIESGKKNNRPKLAAAIEESKRTGARLVIAKLDRLARNVVFIATLMETGVDFVAVDNPTATPFTLHIFAALAEQEAAMISQRTKAALAAKKVRGESMGTPANLTAAARAAGTAAIQTNAANDKANLQARQLIDLLSAQNLTLAAMAERLNHTGYRTRRGCLFTAKSVLRLKSPKATA
ncbi:recombinase family protein [Hymenobacter negativus]|uniref:Recombinase family protein n=1 Tax=Hymenobacter negativus TaxID=2795026 RepID=A0ABS0Q2A8_9BACT|nr:recombinase family protein [Hymenobacter negativus]MBH8556720.1 recombinase family protein [Hymenobacter negativus]